jgi:hypothetical protein
MFSFFYSLFFIKLFYCSSIYVKSHCHPFVLPYLAFFLYPSFIALSVSLCALLRDSFLLCNFLLLCPFFLLRIFFLLHLFFLLRFFSKIIFKNCLSKKHTMKHSRSYDRRMMIMTLDSGRLFSKFVVSCSFFQQTGDKNCSIVQQTYNDNGYGHWSILVHVHCRLASLMTNLQWKKIVFSTNSCRLYDKRFCLSCDNRVFYQTYNKTIVQRNCDNYDMTKNGLWASSYLRHFCDKPSSINCRNMIPMY